MNQYYVGCLNADEVDQVTAKRINKLHGSPGDELKNLRKGQLALIALSRPDLFDKETANKLLKYGDKLLVLNAAIENIITEGRDYKKEQGWLS